MKINSMDNRYSGKEHQSADLRMDSKGKEVQNQILDAKKRLKELSSDNALSEEETADPTTANRSEKGTESPAA